MTKLAPFCLLTCRPSHFCASATQTFWFLHQIGAQGVGNN